MQQYLSVAGLALDELAPLLGKMDKDFLQKALDTGNVQPVLTKLKAAAYQRPEMSKLRPEMSKLTLQNVCQLQNLLLAQDAAGAAQHAACPKQSERVSSVIGVPASPSPPPPASPPSPPPPAEPAEPAAGVSRDWNMVEELLGQLESKQAELECVLLLLPSYLARKPLDKDTELEERERELRALADRPFFSKVLCIVSVT